MEVLPMAPATHRRRVGVVTILGVCGLCCSLAASCRTRYIDHYLPGEIVGGGGGTSGMGSGGAGGGSSGEDCDGVCIGPGEGPLTVLLWIGPKDQAPKAPLRAPWIRYQGYTDMVWASECEACT